MNKKEALDTLIALAVCSDSKLHCDTDCPFYVETETGQCNVKFENNISEAVKTLKGDNNENRNKCNNT